MLPWLLLLSLAVGPLEAADALDPLTRSLYAEGRRLADEGKAAAAVVRFRAVLERDPTWTQAVIDLGRALEATGDLAAAEAVYESRAFDADAAEALARLRLASGRAADAAELYERVRSLRPEWPEAIRLQATALAASDPARADEVFREFLSYPQVDLDAEGVAETALAVVEANRRAGDDARAAALVDHLVATWPGATAQAGISALVARFALEDEAAVLAAVGDRPLDADQAAALAAGRRALAGGEALRAAALLEPIASANPGVSEVWAALADAREANGDVAGAEEAIRLAELLQPFEWRYPARLAELLVAHYAGRYDGEAAAAGRRAAMAPGAPPAVWYRAGQLARLAGDPVAARDLWQRFASMDAVDPRVPEVTAWLAGLDRARPAPPVLPARAERPADVPESAWADTWLAIVKHRHAEGDPARLLEALDTLAPARAAAPRFARALEAEAALRLELGEVDRAIALYIELQEAGPVRPEILWILSGLERRRGDAVAAETWLAAAAAAGSGDALLAQTRAALEAWRPWRARAVVAQYFAGATGGSREEALRLRAEADRQIALARLGSGGLALATSLAPVLWWFSRRRGVGVDGLLAAAPAVWRDVARIASLIRHEVLKHDTTSLDAVADALDAGDPGPAAWAADRLCGPGGAVERFRAWIAELEALGRSAGVRLNLRRRDPLFAPLIAAFDRLAALEPELRAGRGAAEVRALSEQLNNESYRALGALIHRASLAPLDAAAIRGAWRTAGLTGEPVLTLPRELPLVRMFPADLEDVLVNLLRNAAAASPSPDARIGVEVDAEEDDITGLARVVLRVCDEAPRTLSTAAIRGRYIGRGLGLAVDLISRAGGSIHVEDVAGWSKAVVVRLPFAEIPKEEA